MRAAIVIALAACLSGGVGAKLLQRDRALAALAQLTKHRLHEKRDAPYAHCDHGQVRNYDGSCADALVKRTIYAFIAPKTEFIIEPPEHIPNAEVNMNVVFVKTPEPPKPLDPIIVQPPQQKTMVYVLNKKQVVQQEVIEFPDVEPQEPEVFFINYEEGKNPVLPGGIDLETALASAPQPVREVLSHHNSAEQTGYHQARYRQQNSHEDSLPSQSVFYSAPQSTRILSPRTSVFRKVIDTRASYSNDQQTSPTNIEVNVKNVVEDDVKLPTEKVLLDTPKQNLVEEGVTVTDQQDVNELSKQTENVAEPNLSNIDAKAITEVEPEKTTVDGPSPPDSDSPVAGKASSPAAVVVDEASSHVAESNDSASKKQRRRAAFHKRNPSFFRLNGIKLA